MDAPKRLLASTDLSEASEVGLAYAAGLARALDAELVLMVNASLPVRSLLESRAGDRVVEVVPAATEALLELAGRVCPGVTVRPVVVERDFSGDAILEVADREDVDLIVMASRGRSGFRRLVLGSIADRIVRTSPIPVVVVPAWGQEAV